MDRRTWIASLFASIAGLFAGKTKAAESCRPTESSRILDEESNTYSISFEGPSHFVLSGGTLTWEQPGGFRLE